MTMCVCSIAFNSMYFHSHPICSNGATTLVSFVGGWPWGMSPSTCFRSAQRMQTCCPCSSRDPAKQSCMFQIQSSASKLEHAGIHWNILELFWTHFRKVREESSPFTALITRPSVQPSCPRQLLANHSSAKQVVGKPRPTKLKVSKGLDWRQVATSYHIDESWQ